jgi:hypothetical protein
MHDYGIRAQQTEACFPRKKQCSSAKGKRTAGIVKRHYESLKANASRRTQTTKLRAKYEDRK